MVEAKRAAYLIFDGEPANWPIEAVNNRGHLSSERGPRVPRAHLSTADSPFDRRPSIDSYTLTTGLNKHQNSRDYRFTLLGPALFFSFLFKNISYCLLFQISNFNHSFGNLRINANLKENRKNSIKFQ